MFLAIMPLLAACNNRAPAVSAALGRYQAAEASGDLGAKCEQSGQVASAYQRASDAEKYNEWDAKRAADCVAAGKSEPHDDISTVTDNLSEMIAH